MRPKTVALSASQALVTLGEALAVQTGRTEGGFIELGEMLRELHSDATGLTGLVYERADDLRSVIGQNRVSGPDGLAAQSLAEWQAILGETSHLMQCLREVGAALQELRKEIQGIQRISMFLRVSVIGFAIESVSTPECQQAFSAFVGELRALSQRVTELGENLGDELKSTEAAQAERLDHIAADFDQIRGLADQLERTWNETATEVQEFLDASAMAIRETESCLQKISRHADDAVFYMQFGDIVRQKCEHVIASLQEAAIHLSSTTSTRDSRSKCTTAASVVAVQISQLKLIRHELLAAQTKLDADLRGIAAETHSLAGSLRQENKHQCPRAQSENPISKLFANARLVETLRSQGHELGLAARKTAREAVEASGRLSHFLNQVKAINADMHLQALNAIIKTALLDKQGATLEVLSIEVDRLFRESSFEVDRIVAALQKMIVLVNDSPRAEVSSAELAGVDAGLRGALARIGQACQQFKDLSDRAGASAQKHHSWVVAGNEKLQFLGKLADALSRDVEVLESVRELLSASALPDPGL